MENDKNPNQSANRTAMPLMVLDVRPQSPEESPAPCITAAGFLL